MSYGEAAFQSFTVSDYALYKPLGQTHRVGHASAQTVLSLASSQMLIKCWIGTGLANAVGRKLLV